MDEWKESKPCLFRVEMEEERLNLKELYDRVSSEIVRYEGSQRLEKYQRLLSKQRKLIGDINLLTGKIKELKEVDQDEETRIQLDKEHEEINEVIKQFQEMNEEDDSPNKTDEEKAQEHFDKLVEESEEMDKVEEDEKKLTGPEWTIEQKKTQDSDWIDDILEGLGL